jgi:hypothetical protein
MDDLFYSPPAGRGKPSYQALQEKAARQKARLDFLQQHTQLAASLRAQATQSALQRTDSAGSSTSSSSQCLPTSPPPPPTTTTPSPPTATATEVETQTLAAGELRRRYRNYSITFKLHVANFARQNSINKAATTYGLDRKVVKFTSI